MCLRHCQWLAITCALAVVHPIRGMIHDLDIKQDTRRVFSIETFGFNEGGTMDMSVKEFRIHQSKGPYRTGFIMKRAESEGDLQQILEGAIENNDCLLGSPKSTDLVMDLSNTATWMSATANKVVGAGETGLYALIFCRCQPESSTPVTFKIKATFVNPGPDYLSAGESPLPTIFFLFFAAFTAQLVCWALVLRKHSTQVHHVHHMMAMLLVFKTLSMLFEAIRYHYLKVSGAAEAWSIVYYIFAFLKGITLFVVILLIGTGWSLLKPYLNDREKKIILVVLSLQVVDNVAVVVLQETAPGSQTWLTWRDVLHVVDIICCCAILFPIVWSIRHLRQAAQADGKTAATLQKLNLFRHFYIMVFSYIYFTRILVFLLAATLPFQLLWLQDLFTEAATALFFLVTGYKFRPAENNPYLPLNANEGEQPSEYGLQEEEGDLELQPRGIRVAL